MVDFSAIRRICNLQILQWARSARNGKRAWSWYISGTRRSHDFSSCAAVAGSAALPPEGPSGRQSGRGGSPTRAPLKTHTPEAAGAPVRPGPPQTAPPLDIPRPSTPHRGQERRFRPWRSGADPFTRPVFAAEHFSGTMLLACTPSSDHTLPVMRPSPGMGFPQRCADVAVSVAPEVWVHRGTVTAYSSVPAFDRASPPALSSSKASAWRRPPLGSRRG